MATGGVLVGDSSSYLELKLANAVADERRRAARSIHAGVQQRLAAMRVHLSSVLEAEPGGDNGTLGEIALALDAAMAELVETISSVEPSLISEDGLGGALAASCHEASVEVHIHDVIRVRHPARAKLAVYFACREATQNVIRHAGRRARLSVRLWDARDGIGFRFADDGVGFNVAVAHRGVGLLNIRERIESAGGSVSISSTRGAGTVVTGCVPDTLATPGALGTIDSWRSPADDVTRRSLLRRQILLETDTERRRIMRDLHDGAQQGLVALRVRIGLATELAAASSRELGVLERLGSELDLAIAELRDLARGLLVPSSQLALAPALRRVTRHWPMEVRVRERNVRRHARAVEAAVYGCVLETLQDARDERDADAGAMAVVSLFEAPGAFHFVVRGRGSGFHLDRLDAGTLHTVDRAADAGGSLSLRETEHGLVVRGTIPVGAA